MWAVRFHAHGRPAALRLERIAMPVAGAGEVLVRVRACALNGFDPMMLTGSTGLKVPLPMIPCGDVAGEVVAAADDVRDWKPGDRVSVYPMLPGRGMMGEVTTGGCCEFIAIPAAALIALPRGVSFEQAAALPVAYGTALRMMTERGQIRAGERVLILGATGGVGVACVQFAKQAGAIVIGCGSGADKLAALRNLGANEVIDTSQGSFRKALYALYGKPSYDGTSDGGVDVVVNYIGGDTWAEGLKCLRRHGRVLVCGATAGHDPKTDLRYIWSFEQSVIGSNGWTMENQAELLARVAAGSLQPVIHATRPIAQAAEAMQELIDRRVFGKSVLLP